MLFTQLLNTIQLCRLHNLACTTVTALGQDRYTTAEASSLVGFERQPIIQRISGWLGRRSRVYQVVGYNQE